jgi:hypothetical protein
MERESGRLAQAKLVSLGVIGVVLLKPLEICQVEKSLVILSGTRLLKMAHGRKELHNGTRYIP